VGGLILDSRHWNCY